MADVGEPEILVTISPETPDDHRDAIHRAVSVMATRSRDAARRAIERNRACNVLTQRVNAPLRALIDADADAAAALADLQTPVTFQGSASTPPMPDSPPVSFETGEPAPLLAEFAAPQIFGAPWGYQWQWHNGQPPETSSQDRSTGQISVTAFVDSSTSNFSDAHGGFGVSMTSDQVRSVVGRSLRRTTHFGATTAGPLGGTATAEGGMEMTALDGGTLLSSVQDKRFRVRSSSGESHVADSGGGAATGDAVEVSWVMFPGHVCTFNVGCWAFSEAHGGAGTHSFSQATVNGLLIAMTAAFTD